MNKDINNHDENLINQEIEDESFEDLKEYISVNFINHYLILEENTTVQKLKNYSLTGRINHYR